MPKKRHYAKYSKPQSTAPHSLESSGRQSNIHHEEPQSRSVNDILANLRRTALASHANAAQAQAQAQAQAAASAASSLGTSSTPFRRPALSPISAVHPTPSVPPEIAHILLPGVPATPIGPAANNANPNRNANGNANANAAAGGRRPAGPAPPPSWLAQSRHAPRPLPKSVYAGSSPEASKTSLGLDMPGVSRPARGSLVDRALRRMAMDWQIQKHYNQYYLMQLQGPLRAALISYLGVISLEGEGGKGVSIGDLKALLVPPLLPNDNENDNGGEDKDKDNYASGSTLNEDFRYLDLSGSVGQSLSIKEVSDLLFPGGAAKTTKVSKVFNVRENDNAVLESWDLPNAASPPRALLPNLTHLSLALDSESASRGSWRQLLAFAAHLPMLTHLRLAYWPEPTLTPNAKSATVVSHGRRFQYGATGFYSHTLDSDWAEAVLLMRKLSKALYGLEYLDLTGCASWFPALFTRVGSDQVDWAGDWGKITTLVLGGDDTVASDDPEERTKAANTAKQVEQHIRQQRAGQGRFITVEYERRRQ